MIQEREKNTIQFFGRGHYSGEYDQQTAEK